MDETEYKIDINRIHSTMQNTVQINYVSVDETEKVNRERVRIHLRLQCRCLCMDGEPPSLV